MLAGSGKKPPKAMKTGTTICGVVFDVRGQWQQAPARRWRWAGVAGETPAQPPPLHGAPRSSQGGVVLGADTRATEGTVVRAGARRGVLGSAERHGAHAGGGQELREDPLPGAQHLLLRRRDSGRHGEHHGAGVQQPAAAAAADGRPVSRRHVHDHAEAAPVSVRASLRHRSPPRATRPAVRAAGTRGTFLPRWCWGAWTARARTCTPCTPTAPRTSCRT